MESRVEIWSRCGSVIRRVSSNAGNFSTRGRVAKSRPGGLASPFAIGIEDARDFDIPPDVVDDCIAPTVWHDLPFSRGAWAST